MRAVPVLELHAVVVTVLSLTLAGCGDHARVPFESGVGPEPALPEPHSTLIPTVKIAHARGWPQGLAPTAAPGLNVVAYASKLDHPRWLYVLPNGDVLVAETNRPERKEFDAGIRGWVTNMAMDAAGAGG